MTNPTTRRAVLAGTVALPALTVPALANVGADPIFAALAGYKRAVAFQAKCQKKAKAIENDIAAEVGAWIANINKASEATLQPFAAHLRTIEPNLPMPDIREAARIVARKETYKKYAAELEAAERAGNDAEIAAWQTLLDTIPTTAAGTVALLGYIIKEIEGETGSLAATVFEAYRDEAPRLLRTLQAVMQRA